MWWSSRTCPALVAAGLLFAPAPAGATPTLFGVTFNSGVPEQLVRIDPSTGGASVVGTLGYDIRAFDLATRDGRLYAFDSIHDRIVEIDPGTGAILNPIDIGIGDRIGEGSLDFRSDGTGFLSESRGHTGQLWSFDLETGTSTALTEMGGLAPSLDGLAFQPGTDTLFGLAQWCGGLYTVDPASGKTELVGATGISGNVLAGLAFGPDGGLFAATGGFLYSIDPLTGQADVIGSTGLRNVSGLVFLDPLDPASPEPIGHMPEPSTMLLLGGGLLGLGARVRRRRNSKT
jgi:outer membrane protein assembly factor BamB